MGCLRADIADPGSKGDIASPRAYGALTCSAQFKTVPGDFRVTERLSFQPGGVGEHLYLHIEKAAVETLDVAERLRRFYGVRPLDVGYAGHKDKRSLARQWFSICTPSNLAPAGADGVRVIGRGRHHKKLRRGEHAGNDFVVRLRQLHGDAWLPRLTDVAARGAPNYFGPQRFAAGALRRARTWLQRPGAGQRGHGWYLSVLRSYLFNEVLGHRVLAGNWDRLIDGDVATGTDSTQCLPTGPFPTGPFPTGPLWGRGRLPSSGSAAELERRVLAGHGEIRQGLEVFGLRQDRRCLVLRPHGLRWQATGGDLHLVFSLGPGGYATSLLREVFALRGAVSGV